MTMNVEFVRAGAGSGKTYYLTHLLANRLKDGSARPHAVIATTFTVKAASQLRERARATLLKEGRLDLSAAIGQARIGTVNSVCGQLIQRFCFELGISPEQTVLDEAQGRRLVRIAIESVQSPHHAAQLMAIAGRLGIDEESLTDAISKIMDAARANNLQPDAVARMGRLNADAMLANWPPPDGDYTAALEHALATVQPQLEAVHAAGNATKVLTDGIDQVARARERLANERLPWSEWHKLAGLAAGAKQAQICGLVQDQARRHGSHNQFHADVREYLEAVFGLAARALQVFADTKRDLGVVDFTDQEVMLLRALQSSELVRRALCEEVDLVLVDEFQDTNPLQLAIFAELAKLAKASIWVGDQKQAVYGFRGTDSSLIQQVLESVQSWGGTVGTPLSKSWRSTPALVALTNESFVPAFAPTPAEDVALVAQRAQIPGQPDLLNWSFVIPPKKRSLNLTALGPAVHGLLARGLQVQDKASGQLRPMRPDDIAVLCRTNAAISQVVHALGRWHIPAAAERPGLLQTAEARLVLACLRRMYDPSDTLASATVIGLVDSLDPEQWLQDRLQFLADAKNAAAGRTAAPPLASWKVTGHDAHPLLARLESQRSKLLSLTPHEAMRLAKAESGVARLAHQWSSDVRAAQVRIANVEALLALARDYEEACVGSRQPATTNGLLVWLAAKAGQGQDGRAAAVNGAVEVMTFHGAKGLEWPVVIVAGLDHPHRTDLWNVRARTLSAFDAEEPLANRFIHFWPYPYGSSSTVPAAVLAENSPTGRAMDLAALQENTRLLYVTMTRARDMTVLVGGVSKPGVPPATAWLDEIAATSQLWGESGQRKVGGVQVARESQEWDWATASAAAPSVEPQVLRYFPASSPKEIGGLWFAPSAQQGAGFHVGAVESVGTRIPVQLGTDMNALGTALHACFAYAVADPHRGIGLGEVQEILTAWGVADAVDTAAALAQVKAFMAWWSIRWPGAVAQAELPIEARRADGSIVRGQIDLLLQVAGGRVLIDHKADPRAVGDGARLALEHGAQLDAYAQAVRTVTGQDVLERWLFLPVAAKAVRIDANEVSP